MAAAITMGLRQGPLLLYGSESGTAADLAARVAALGERRLLSMRPEGLDTAVGAESDPVAALRARALTGSGGMVILMVSTMGDGEVPNNMAKFWRACLRRSLGADALAGVSYALYALGDSGYGHKYCAAGRKLDQRLQQLGAQPCVPRVLADDQNPMGGVVAGFGPWLTELWPAVLRSFPLPEGFVVDESPRLPTPTAAVTVVRGGGEPPSAPSTLLSDSYRDPFKLLGLSTPPLMARMVSNERMTAVDWSQDVRHVQLELPPLPHDGSAAASSPGERGSADPNVRWHAGDVAWVLPENDEAAVAVMLELFGLDATDVIDVAPLGPGAGGEGDPMEVAGGQGELATDLEARVDGGPLLARRLTAGELFGRALAIHSVPRPFAFETLALFATIEEEREKLEELASAEGADLYHSYCYREKRGWYEILGEFKSLGLREWDLSVVIDLIPRLQPRAFSIARASEAATTSLAAPARQSLDAALRTLEVCVAVLSYKTPWKRPRAGVCSTWLSKRSVGDAVPVWIGPGTFPEATGLATDAPLIMIGPGTGVAPMRAFLQARLHRRAIAAAQGAPSAALPLPPPDVLFFGCRGEKKDYLYGNEWQALQASGQLVLHTAFSRDQGQKIYVQHRIAEAGDLCWGLLANSGASVFVAGSTRMSKDVHSALRGLAMSRGGMDAKQADAFMRRLEKQKRYCVEAYG